MKYLHLMDTKDDTTRTATNAQPKRTVVDCQFRSDVEFDHTSTLTKLKRRKTTPTPQASECYFEELEQDSVCTPNKRYSPISSIDTVDDVFMNILDFFVSENHTDVLSLQSMNLVNKRWSEIVSSSRFWRLVSKTTSLLFSRSLDHRLAGYKNLGVDRDRELSASCHPTRSYNTIEKSTGKMFHLDITNCGENDGHHQSILREIAVSNDVQRFRSEKTIFTKHLSLIQNWQSLDGQMLCWYEQEDETLRSFLNKGAKNLRHRPELVTGILFQVLLGLASLHHCNLAYRTLCADNILLFWEGSEDIDSYIPLVKIKNFIHCKGLDILGPEGSPVECDISSDIFCFGKLLGETLSVIHGQSASLETSGGEGAADILKRIFGDADNRITASNLLKHPYFARIPPSLLMSSIVFCPTSQLRLLKTAESIHYSHYNIRRTVLPSKQWATLVDWLFEIASVFHINSRAVFSAMDYFKVCLAVSCVEKKDLQLLAATCLYIASKYEDDRHISISDIPMCADQIFNESDILSMEGKILHQIGWVLSNPTIFDFAMNWLLHIGIGKDKKIFWVVLFISELALQTDIIHSFKSSEIAAAVIAIARYSLNEQVVWSETLERYSGYSWSHLKRPLLALSSMLQARGSFHSLKIIHRRYSKDDRMGASSVTIRQIKFTCQLESISKHRSATKACM